MISWRAKGSDSWEVKSIEGEADGEWEAQGCEHCRRSGGWRLPYFSSFRVEEYLEAFHVCGEGMVVVVMEESRR